MQPVDLERLAHRSLRQLPTPVAPATLLPRVLAAIERCARRPWYSRTWLTWPAGWQAASVVALLAVIAAGFYFFPVARTMVEQTAAAALASAPADVTVTIDRVATTTGRVSNAAAQAEATTGAMRAVWRAVFAPFAAYALGLVALMCAICALFARALTQVVSGKAFSQ